MTTSVSARPDRVARPDGNVGDLARKRRREGLAAGPPGRAAPRADDPARLLLDLDLVASRPPRPPRRCRPVDHVGHVGDAADQQRGDALRGQPRVDLPDLVADGQAIATVVPPVTSTTVAVPARRSHGASRRTSWPHGAVRRAGWRGPRVPLMASSMAAGRRCACRALRRVRPGASAPAVGSSTRGSGGWRCARTRRGRRRWSRSVARRSSWGRRSGRTRSRKRGGEPAGPEVGVGDDPLPARGWSCGRPTTLYSASARSHALDGRRAVARPRRSAWPSACRRSAAPCSPRRRRSRRAPTGPVGRRAAR